MPSRNEDQIADPVQTAPKMTYVCMVCPDLVWKKLRHFIVLCPAMAVQNLGSVQYI